MQKGNGNLRRLVACSKMCTRHQSPQVPISLFNYRSLKPSMQKGNGNLRRLVASAHFRTCHWLAKQTKVHRVHRALNQQKTRLSNAEGDLELSYCIKYRQT